MTVLFSVVLALIGILVVPQILPVLFPEYAGTLEVVPIISLCIIPTTISTLYISQFLGNEKSGHLVLTSIVSIIVLVIGILSLGQIFGVFGLAYSLLISDIVFRVIFLDKINKTFTMTNVIEPSLSQHYSNGIWGYTKGTCE